MRRVAELGALGHLTTRMSQDFQRPYGWKFWVSFATAGFLFYAFAISGGFSIRLSEFSDMQWDLGNTAVIATGVVLFGLFVACCVYCIRCVFR